MDILGIDLWLLLLMFVLGFAGGFMAGMLGVGGGIIFVPFLHEIVKGYADIADRVPYVLANSLAIVCVVGISGSVKQYKLKNTDIRASLVTGLSAICTSLLVSSLLKHFEINEPKLFSYVFILILVLTAARILYGKIREKDEIETLNMPKLGKFIPAGLFAGVITSMTGLGGGIVMVPYFNRVLKLPIKFSTGLSLSVIPIITLPLLVFYIINKPAVEVYPGMQSGYIMWTAILPIIIAAVIAAPFGVRVAQKLSSNTLLTIFLVFIAITIVKTLWV